MKHAKNLVFIISDEHNPKILGCSGDRLVLTPNLDQLAARGTRFPAAYCNSPACVPARAVLATGRYAHDVRSWDNAHPYMGNPISWHRVLRDAGVEVASIGKLHFRSVEDDNGFSEEIIPMHVVDGVGDLGDLIRDELNIRGGVAEMANQAGPGESTYTKYDRDIAEQARRWIRTRATPDAAPWALFISLVAPHFPLTAPEEFYFRYYDDPDLPWPKQYAAPERPRHPYIVDYARSLDYDSHFDTDDKVRRAMAGYYGLVSFLDQQVGLILGELDAVGLTSCTDVIYTSDHGENLGARGLWGKTTMYEESVGVPLIAAGPSFNAGAVHRGPVTHVDLFPTVLDSLGVLAQPPVAGLRGASLAGSATVPANRVVFAEFHGMGSRTGSYMVRDERYKYVYYVGYPAQLFDLLVDPEELRDVAAEPEMVPVIERLDAELRSICDPEAINDLAKSDQSALLEKHGGKSVIQAKGDFSFSPAPGTQAVFERAAPDAANL
ncbi:sulfatase-like hydrolase/transferase [Bordetella genomosp. 12]|uniref:Sulfatase n=1 Tax=Bordetella genomosp. 12 TaxID=463035 RepID=A0A261VEL9_9BORD|nr:sulfatase-like hydrolase/transferase [Bordetella genomosp. 12]OZI71603.1 sulfatase [Bordetella genomosp. 12]